MKNVDAHLLEALARRAGSAARGRVNHNLHPVLEDPVQRFVNALEPGSYVAPHRHADPARWELFTRLTGSAVVLTFAADGRVLERVELGSQGAVIAEVPAGAWHTVVATSAGTALLEIKPGPYLPLEDKDFAPWAPREGEAGWQQTLGWLVGARPGDRPPTPS